MACPHAAPQLLETAAPLRRLSEQGRRAAERVVRGTAARVVLSAVDAARDCWVVVVVSGAGGQVVLQVVATAAALVAVAGVVAWAVAGAPAAMATLVAVARTGREAGWAARAGGAGWAAGLADSVGSHHTTALRGG
jgi:hypothetical protein